MGNVVDEEENRWTDFCAVLDDGAKNNNDVSVLPEEFDIVTRTVAQLMIIFAQYKILGIITLTSDEESILLTGLSVYEKYFAYQAAKTQPVAADDARILLKFIDILVHKYIGVKMITDPFSVLNTMAEFEERQALRYNPESN